MAMSVLILEGIVAMLVDSKVVRSENNSNVVLLLDSDGCSDG